MHIHHPVLIVGQGIAGTLLSFMLYRRNIPFMVIDMPASNPTSYTSGAVLNPYSGKTKPGVQRRSVMYDTAIGIYREMESFLGIPLVSDGSLVFFDSDREPQPDQVESFRDFFQHFETVHICDPVAMVHNEVLLKAWNTFLKSGGLLMESVFEEQSLTPGEDAVAYKGAYWHAVVYCNGVAARDSNYFSPLRFTRNRGEVLYLHINGLPEQVIFNKGKTRLIPKGNGLYWCGSNYNWDFEDMIPDERWKAETIALLQSWMKLPFEEVEHTCAERPTTVGQIPFIGWHPLYKRIGICNGLGTKGFSAGPLWITDFVANMMLDEGRTQYQSVLDKFLS
jgi:glycine/D-amino acid oxidase-like deaminating enzyme